jgi:hypothetical protein
MDLRRVKYGSDEMLAEILITRWNELKGQINERR